MTTTRPSSDSRVERAERLFGAFLAEHDGETAAIDELYRSHADLADELRGIEHDHASAKRTLAAFGAPLERPDSGKREPEPYRLIRRVARGGMGEVLEVWDRRLRRVLAMKRTPNEIGTTRAVDRRRLARFLREARITGRLEHPGIVPVHSLGRDRIGRAYYTMPLVRGHDFGAIVDAVHAGSSDWTRTGALQVLVNVCQAVAYAHSCGVMHRDLKPGNVMVGEFGETYVVDWGLARPFEENEHGGEDERGDDVGGDRSAGGTRFGDVIGTPAYMPPEQAAGRWDEVGPAADVYAVGAMLYQLLSGREPYSQRADADGDAHDPGLDVVAAVLEGAPTPLSDAQSPPELVSICARAMAREISDRYPTMKALASDLSAYLEGRVVRAHAHGPWAELVKWIQRNRAAAILAGVALAATIGGLSAVVVLQSRAAKRAAADLATLQRSLYFNDIALAQQARDRTTSDLRTLLDGAPAHLRGWEWWLLDRYADESTAVLSVHDQPVVDLAFFPDGERLVSASRDHTLRIWDVATGASIATLTGHTDNVEDVCVAADGARIASAGIDRTVRIWNGASGALERTLRGHTDTVRCVEFTPGGGLLSVSEDGLVLAWPADGDEPSATVASLTEAVTSLAVDARGGRFVIGTNDGEVRLFALGEREPLAVQRLGNGGRLVDLRYDASGDRIVASSFDEVVYVLDARDVSVLETIAVEATPFETLFAGDGELVTTENAGLRTLGIERGEPRSNLCGHPRFVVALAAAPSGAQLASGSVDGTIRLWERGSDAVYRELADEGELLSAVDIAPATGRRGELVVGSGRDGIVRVWDSDSGALMHRFETRAWIDDLVVLPDGARALVATLEGEVLLLDLESGIDRYAALVTHPRHAGRVRSVAHNGAERWASVASDRTLSLWSLAGELIWTRTLDAEPYAVDFVAGGNEVVTSDADGTLVFWRAADGTHSSTIATDEDDRVLVRASDDGSAIAVVGANGGLEVWDVASRRRRFRVEAHELWAQDVRFSRDGERLFTAGYGGWFKVWDARSGRSALSLRPAGAPLGALAIGRAGTVACTGEETNVHVFAPRLPDVTSPGDSSPPR